MVTQAIETPVDETDQEQVVEQTETPAEVTPPAESAAAETPEAAAVPQVTVSEEKPDYLTRADWEREKAEVASRAAADALENDRRRRQTENARAAAQAKRDLEDRAELVDTVKAAFGAKGYFDVPDDIAISAVDRAVRKRTDQLVTAQLDHVGAAWDYLTAPAYGKQAEIDESAEPAAKMLLPKVQHLIDTLRPQIEAEARKGWVAESDLPKLVEDEIARRNAGKRQGQEEIQRVEGSSSNLDRSHEATIARIAANTHDATDAQYYARWKASRSR